MFSLPLSLCRAYTWCITLFSLPRVTQLGFYCWDSWATIYSGWPIIRKISFVARTATVKSGARSPNTLNAPICWLMGPNTTVSCWFQDSGEWHVTSTILETWWAPWHIVCLVALSTSCLTSTSFSWAFFWFIGASGMNTDALASMVKTGSGILMLCLTGLFQAFFK